MLTITNLSFSYGIRPIFTKTGFSISIGQKVGLVGPNGAGKTTLYNLISGKELPDEGNIELLGTVATVAQEIKHDPKLENSKTIRQYINPNNQTQDYELEELLRGLEMPNLKLNDNPQPLSGGQKTKLAIIRALILKPDLLLLDEPTNFLDIQGKKWVMNFLANYPKTLFIVSHDLALLNHSIDKVIAVNPETAKFEEYTGNYDSYLKQKKQKDNLIRTQVLNEQKRIQRMKESAFKMLRFKSDRGVKQRIQLEKRIERLEANLPALPKEVATIKFSFPAPIHTGNTPLIVKSLCKSYGENKVINELSFFMQKGERLALIGCNGAGKSTLIKMLVGILSPDNGEIIKYPNLSIGYYSQEFETFNMEKTLFETIGDIVTYEESKVRSILGKFMFFKDKVFQKIATLSGGEKTRLAIAMILCKSHNFLILDEPTTYLDVLSQKIILEALKSYPGTMIIVSHTQEFIQELKPQKAILLPEHKVKPWDDSLLNQVSYI